MSEHPGSLPVKFTITHYRQPKRTHEEFKKWITEEHLPLALPVFQKHGILGYTLFFTPQALNNTVKGELSKINPTWDFAEYDCLIEYILPSTDSIEAVTGDPDWAVAVANQNEWVDVPRALVSVGYTMTYLMDGNIANPPK
ncbi:hypothetical protein QQS21_005395 [Conoideocrella luteorostrata]|uniref:EthD domain-containing protein n=1 Tax=Conoideocrella luteorostrata TaxID=1105319 RepID=A0AAJ0FUI0_9HYPO|nr:hypothetical protein QQS21_005395 [Conoideocrella luteorostrata]